MAFDWSTLALQTINVVVLIWLLQRFLYRPVLRLVDARRAEIEGEYRAAAEAEAAVAASRAAVETERAGIAAERTAALAAAATQAERAAQDRLAEAEARSRAILDEAGVRLAREREEALAGLQEMALDLAVDMAGRLLTEIAADRRADLWLARVESCLSHMSASERAGLLVSGDDRLRVVSDLELPETTRAEWGERLRAALGRDLEFEFAADPDLVAGVDLHFPAAVLSLSLRGAREAIRAEAQGHG